MENGLKRQVRGMPLSGEEFKEYLQECEANCGNYKPAVVISEHEVKHHLKKGKGLPGVWEKRYLASCKTNP